MIPRDDLRVVTIIPWADKWITQTVERAWYWADEILVGVESGPQPDFDADAVVVPDAESQTSMNIVWREAERRFDLDESDYVAVLYSGEIIVESSTVRAAIRKHPGERIGAKLHWMWTDSHYRTDQMPPMSVYPFIPFYPKARFEGPARMVHRGPTFAWNKPTVDVPAGNMLAYRYSNEHLRDVWIEFYRTTQRRDFGSPPEGFANILRTPAQLETWKYGGLL